MIQEVDTALNKGNFQVKQWTKTGDTGQVKFFSYMYHPQFDTFNVRPHVNWSPRKRGARTAPDVKNIAELQQHAKQFSLTKRSVASLVMGTLFDPLMVMSWYILILKIIYRDLTRILNTKGEHGLDTVVPVEISDRVIKALSYFLR